MGVEISGGVGGVSVYSGGQCNVFPDDWNIKEMNLSDSISIMNWMENLKLLKWLRKVCSRSSPGGQTTDISTLKRNHSGGLCCSESRDNLSKYSM
jgi:hypothetical protein